MELRWSLEELNEVLKHQILTSHQRIELMLTLVGIKPGCVLLRIETEPSQYETAVVEYLSLERSLARLNIPHAFRIDLRPFPDRDCWAEAFGIGPMREYYAHKYGHLQTVMELSFFVASDVTAQKQLLTSRHGSVEERAQALGIPQSAWEYGKRMEMMSEAEFDREHEQLHCQEPRFFRVPAYFCKIAWWSTDPSGFPLPQDQHELVEKAKEFLVTLPQQLKALMDVDGLVDGCGEN